MKKEKRQSKDEQNVEVAKGPARHNNSTEEEKKQMHALIAWTVQQSLLCGVVPHVTLWPSLHLGHFGTQSRNYINQSQLISYIVLVRIIATRV